MTQSNPEHLLVFKSLLRADRKQNGLNQVKEEGWTGFSKGRQGCSKGFPIGLELLASYFAVEKKTMYKTPRVQWA